MASDSDPYRKWLGIKSDGRPPNHYELLGLEPFESREDVIDAASIKRVDLLQDIASGGTHVELSQRILNEVSVARLCLLGKHTRERYELTLKKKMAGMESAEERITRLTAAKDSAKTVEPPPESQRPDDLSSWPELSNPVQPIASPRRSTKPVVKKKRSSTRVWLFLIVAILIVIVSLVGVLLYVVPKLNREFESRDAIDAAVENSLLNRVPAVQPNGNSSSIPPVE